MLWTAIYKIVNVVDGYLQDSECRGQLFTGKLMLWTAIYRIVTVVNGFLQDSECCGLLFTG